MGYDKSFKLSTVNVPSAILLHPIVKAGEVRLFSHVKTEMYIERGILLLDKSINIYGQEI